jgi:uncharacterized protein (AIM24 family)
MKLSLRRKSSSSKKSKSLKNRRRSSNLNSEKLNKLSLTHNSEKWTICQKGVNSTVKVKIPFGKKIRIEKNAILTMNKDVDLDVTSNFVGGFFSKQSMIQTFAEAKGPNATVMLAPESYGDIAIVNISETGPLKIMKSCYLASSNSVDINITTQSFSQTLLSGGGLTIMNAVGSGIVAIHGSGGINKIRIRPGDKIKVDNGYQVAWDNNVDFTMVTASSGYASSMLSGAGFMCEFSGDGYVYMQSRQPIRDMVIRLIRQYCPRKN